MGIIAIILAMFIIKALVRVLNKIIILHYQPTEIIYILMLESEDKENFALVGVVAKTSNGISGLIGTIQEAEDKINKSVKWKVKNITVFDTSSFLNKYKDNYNVDEEYRETCRKIIEVKKNR